MKPPSNITKLSRKLDQSREPAFEKPEHCNSLRDFLLNHAVAKAGKGGYVPYSIEGRPALDLIIDIVDLVLGSHTGEPLNDSSLAIGGGAQWGKTVFALNAYAYLLQSFMNVGYYLPDDDLVQAIIDTKFRPDVVDQIDWFAEMMVIGKALNNSGRQVNRKGAMTVTDGEHTAQGYCRGMGKIPTSFSMDVVMTDERDDIDEKKARYLKGRTTSSEQRFQLDIGTMRYDGAGQNKIYKEGSQHICMMTCPCCGAQLNPEEKWPEICRKQLGDKPGLNDPQLNPAGMFVDEFGDIVDEFDIEGEYYLGCPTCASFLDRQAITSKNWIPQRPEMIKKRKWSIRVAQIGTPAIDLIQIVKDWCDNAVKDPDAMNAFCCDRLALPKSTSQAVDAAVIQRARSLETFDFESSTRPGCVRYAGLDTGDRCWFVAREIETELIKRLCWAEALSAERVRARMPQLFELLGLSCLFVDAGPLRDLARDLAFDLNGLREQNVVIDSDRDYINFGNGVVWDGPNQRWLGLRCAPVEFTQRPGLGIKHKLGKSQDGLYYPIIAANRNESIQVVINELLTPTEGVYHSVDGKVRTDPIYRLPQKVAGSNPMVETYESHLLIGSRKEKTDNGKDEVFVDGCENHLLLGTTYASLAEIIGGTSKVQPFHSSVPSRDKDYIHRRGRGRKRTGAIG